MLQIALDAMGADNGVEPVVCGLLQALQNRNFKAYLVGDTALLKTSLDSKNLSSDILQRIELLHTDDYVRMEEKKQAMPKNAQPLLYIMPLGL